MFSFCRTILFVVILPFCVHVLGAFQSSAAHGFICKLLGFKELFKKEIFLTDPVVREIDSLWSNTFKHAARHMTKNMLSFVETCIFGLTFILVISIFVLTKWHHSWLAIRGRPDLFGLMPIGGIIGEPRSSVEKNFPKLPFELKCWIYRHGFG